MQHQVAPAASSCISPSCNGSRVLVLVLLLTAPSFVESAGVPAALTRLRHGGRPASQKDVALSQGSQRSRGQSTQETKIPPRAFRDLEPNDDAFLRLNLWKGQGMAGQFRFLDDLEPVAPMDSIGPPTEISRLDAVAYASPGTPSDAMFVPPYLNPDAFPAVEGGKCTCERPPASQPPEERPEWTRMVAKQLGVRVSELPHPQNLHGHPRCRCNTTADGAYHWVRDQPVYGSSAYELSPADVTFAAGDYWSPRIPGGVVAPQDKMPVGAYPLQASGDRIRPLPINAVEDRVGGRLATYVDQLESRSRACDGVSPRCTVPCGPGDGVELRLGNTRLNATVTSVLAGAALVVAFSPAAAPAGAVPCPLAAGCSAFRTCYGAPRRGLLRGAGGGSACVAREDRATHDVAGVLRHSLRCPAGTAPCGVVEQMVDGSRLRRGGKACRPAAVGPKAE